MQFWKKNFFEIRYTEFTKKSVKLKNQKTEQIIEHRFQRKDSH